MIFLLILRTGRPAVKQARLAEKVQMGRLNRHKQRPMFGFGLFLCFALSLAFTFLGCSAHKGPPAAAALIDEAFGRLFPETVSFLAHSPGLIDLGKTTLAMTKTSKTGEANLIRPESLSAVSRELLLDWQTQNSTPKALIASPLAARKLVQGFLDRAISENKAEMQREDLTEGLAALWIASALPHLVIPFGDSSGLNGLSYWSIGYDYVKAYETLGRKAADAVVNTAGKQSAFTDMAKPYCLVLFQENILRGKEALEAFKNSFCPIAGEAALKIELLPSGESSADSRGAFEQILFSHLGDAQSEKPVVIVLGIDNAFAAEEAAGGSIGASEQKDGLKPLYMADCGSWGKSPSNRRRFAWRIEADGLTLGEKAEAVAAALAKDREAEKVSLVPLRILAGSRIF